MSKCRKCTSFIIGTTICTWTNAMGRAKAPSRNGRISVNTENSTAADAQHCVCRHFCVWDRFPGIPAPNRWRGFSAWIPSQTVSLLLYTLQGNKTSNLTSGKHTPFFRRASLLTLCSHLVKLFFALFTQNKQQKGRRKK